MLVPVACFSCGRRIGDVWGRYNDMLAAGTTPQEAFDALRLRRYCCRRMLASTVETMDRTIEFQTETPAPPMMVRTQADDQQLKLRDFLG